MGTAARKAVMVYDMNTSFMRRDVEIFESAGYEVLHCEIQPASKGLFLRSLMRQLAMLIAHRKEDTLWVCQSAGYLSLLPALFSRIFGMRCLIIVIGTDGAHLPEIQYGHYRKPLLALCAAASLRNCDGIAPVHRSLERSDYTYFDVKHKQQGFRAFVSGITAEVREVVNGYDQAKWGVDVPFENRKPDLLTVFVASRAQPAIRKGLDLIVEAAKALPDRNFLIVGEAPSKFDLPKNIRVQGNVDQKVLRQIYNEHKYYLQVSAFEGFPNALCEAMACGCIPIGSNVAGIPDIIQNWGELIPSKDVHLLTDAIHRAEIKGATTPHVCEEISKHLFLRFPLERRKRELIAFATEISTEASTD